jgi:hypothetical protein
MLRPRIGQKLLVRSTKSEPHNSELMSHGLMAVYAKVTREYLMQSLTNTVNNEALAVEHRSACHTLALLPAEQAKNMVIPTPQYVELPLYAKYREEGEPLPHGGPPIPVTGHQPHPLGHLVQGTPSGITCVMCPLEDIHFKELYELAKTTPPAACTWEMNVE